MTQTREMLMKLLAIVIKDLRRSFTNAFFLAMGLGLPLITAALFYFAFGGLVSDEGFDLPTTQVQIVNLDQANPQYGNFVAGELLVEFFRSEELSDLLEVTQVEDAVSARAAVDNQQAGVAVIIPENLTASVFDPEGQAAIELYQDPTLTLGPGIVKTLVNQFVDGFAGSKIAANVAHDRLIAEGATVNEAMMQGLAMQYADWSAALGERQQEGATPLLDLRAPSNAGTGEEQGETALMIGMIMAGMMTFYTFFTGAASAESILREEEDGTLPRLFTTPTPQSIILGGKVLANFILVTVQVLTLVVASTLVFKIDWGEPLPIGLMTLGLVVVATCFGLFITSLLKDTKQSGIVYGGVMTVFGMLGMSSVFTAGTPDASGASETLSLITPHGWSVRGWVTLLEGGGVSDVLLTVGVMLGLGIVFFVIGVLKFRKRFA